MDKYEFNIKVEQIRKLVNKGDYETAMKIADTIDWKRVRNANLLSMVATVYEKNGEYQDAKDILLLAFERAPIGKRLLFKLTDLALKEGSIDEAEAYYREFCDLAVDDPRQHLLRYLILKEKGAPSEQLIHSLESYTAEELDERWLYELAELYHEAGDSARCVSTCDKIMLMFGLGKYVDKAMELKIQYAPLTKYQVDLVENREKYEEKLRRVERSSGLEEPEEDMEEDTAGYPGQDAEDAEDAVLADPVPPAAAEEEEPVLPYEKVSIAAAVKQAEIEENLAREMSRLKDTPADQEESELGKTRVLGEIRHAQTEDVPAEPKASAAPVVEEAAEEQEPLRMANHLMIEARTPEKGLELAVRTLKQIQKETGVKNPVAKITGSKLNKRGILASADKLAGKDLIVEEAGDLQPEMLKELEKLMAQDTSGMRIILIDNPKQMEMLHGQNPELADKFESISSDYPMAPAQPEHPAQEGRQPGEAKPEHREAVAGARGAAPGARGAAPKPQERPRFKPTDEFDDEPDAPEDEDEMDIDEFAQYACKYASEIDCSITGKSMLALYERIEVMEEDGIPLTKTTAEDLIEEAADKAEKPSVGKMIKGLFSSKYDKDGLLILKEEHFI